MKVRVKVVYPLKQGLKPFSELTLNLTKSFVKVVYPLKQGLKLLRNLPIFFVYCLLHVKVVYPLKQGLKPKINKDETRFRFDVKVVYPLKQGLKRSVCTITISNLEEC